MGFDPEAINKSAPISKPNRTATSGTLIPRQIRRKVAVVRFSTGSVAVAFVIAGS